MLTEMHVPHLALERANPWQKADRAQTGALIYGGINKMKYELFS